jgi:hypothetical protein
MALVGIVLVGASIAGMVYFMPRKGQIHAWVDRPFLESGIPLVLMACSIFGVALLCGAFI